MTQMQMPYGYPPQQPQQYAPPMPYAAPQYPQAPPQQYGYPQPQAAPTPPPAPVVNGTIDQFYGQPSAAGGPGISWKDKPLGTSYAGVISGQVRVQQDTDFDTGRPLFQRDQVTPKWVMLIPLSSVQSNVPTQEFPDGEAVFYVRGQARDELVRAMSEAGCSGEPKQGAGFQVTLTNRKPNRKGNPSNIVQIKYVPPGGVPHNEQQPAAQAESAAAPAPTPVPQAAPTPQAPALTVDQTIAQQQATGQQPPQWAQAPAPPVQPQQQVQAPVQPTLQMPADFDPAQQALLARITGQQAGQPA